MNEEFYVGYIRTAPPVLARRIRSVIALLVLIGLALCLLLVAGQAPFAASRFEFQVYREYKGEFLDWPYPMLLTDSGPLLLVNPGKHGFLPDKPVPEGQFVQLEGALIQRGADRMLEVLPGSVRPLAQQPSRAAEGSVDLGFFALSGEIVDSKCFLGVMNPGNGKVHRDCAVRCISGGIPPAFAARDAKGGVRLLLMTGADGRRLNREVLSFVAEPIRLRGRLIRAASTFVLKTEPRDFQRE